MRHQEYKQLQVILEGKIEEKRGMDGNTLIHGAQHREEFAIVIANLNRDSTWEEEDTGYSTTKNLDWHKKKLLTGIFWHFGITGYTESRYELVDFKFVWAPCLFSYF